MKQRIMLLLMFFLSVSAYSQYADQVKGYIVDSETRNPLQGVSVLLENQKMSSVTDTNGEFIFRHVYIGDDVLVVSSAAIGEVRFPLTIRRGKEINLGDFEVSTTSEISYTRSTDAFVATLDELDLDAEADVATQGISSLILLSDDPYLSATSFQFSPTRFKNRGYANKYEQTFLSGIEFNDQIRGQFNFSMIGAMNDMTRNGDNLNYMQPGNFTFGSIGGSQNINLRAGNYAKGGKITGSYTNRNYYLRGMASYSTGLMDNGWAFSGLIGGRYSDEGNIDGTFYNNLSYFFAAEKQWDGGRHSLSFTTFGSPVQRGQAAASVQEAYDLVGDNLYNPNWGYQDGKKRNARIVTAYDPTAIISHIFKVNKDTKVTTGFGIHYNRYGSTALNWFGNAADPRPDYYRNLPSYQTNDSLANISRIRWESNDPTKTQINWDELYLANLGRENAAYIVEERRNDLFEMSLNSTLETRLSKNIMMTAGLGLRSSRGMTFATVNDLMGAQYVLDVDKYGERDFPGNDSAKQNDLNNPNRKVTEGDRYGYDYAIQTYSTNGWLQNVHQYANIDVYYGLKLSYTSYYRDGKMRNGRYPTDSYGKGKVHEFVNQTTKAGFTYKIDGRNFIVGNFSYGNQAPLPYDAYISPRVRDKAVPELESEKILAMDLGYVFSFPTLKGRLSAFQTNFYDQTSRSSYYHDYYRTYLHHVIYGMNKVHRGLELGLSWKATSALTVSFGGTVSEYYYSNNPMGQVFYENDKKQIEPEKVFFKGFYVGSTPQVAGTIGLNYFYKYWFFGTNLNGFAKSYLDPAPARRVHSSLGFVEYDPEVYAERVREFVAQKSLNGGLTLDMSVGKLLFLNNGHSVNFNLSVNNVLNYKNLQTGGYEQGRIDTDNYTLTKFPPKFYYMQGINCYFNASYRF